MPSRIEAAGGVLWRHAHGRYDVEIALVHRPGHDDWSLPKGKLRTGEHPVLGALREVAEETGHTGAVGGPLGSTRYLKDGTPKRVRYWAMRAEQGEFAVSDEVDDLVWLPPDAAGRLARGRDRPVIRAFTERSPHHAWPVLLVRQGNAVSGDAWSGADRDRPLDVRGRQQADVLGRLLDAYGVRSMLAADVRRCHETLEPLAERQSVDIESEPLFSKGRSEATDDHAIARLMGLATSGVPTAICAQGSVVSRLCDGLVAALSERSHRRGPDVRKGGYYAVHLTTGGPLQVAALEQFATSA